MEGFEHIKALVGEGGKREIMLTRVARPQPDKYVDSHICYSIEWFVSEKRAVERSKHKSNILKFETCVS